MKRTFISSLVQSNKKPHQNNKADKNVKLSTKSIFQQNKQNINPNLIYQNSSKKYQKLKSQSKFKSNHKARSSNKKVQTFQPLEEESFLSPFKRDAENQQRKQLLQTIRCKCSKLKQLLSFKHQKQIKKCREYYNFIRQELSTQQMDTLSQLNKCFQQAHKQLEKYKTEIDNSMSVRTNKINFIIELPLLSVFITQEMKQFAKIQIQKLNLLNYSSEIDTKRIQNKFQTIKFQLENPIKEFQTPINLQNYYIQRKTQQKYDISYFGAGRVEDQEMSPSFRKF